MMSIRQESLLSSSHDQTARLILVYLIMVITVATFSCSLANSREDSPYRLFKNGDVIIGGLISVHSESDGDKCKTVRSDWLALFDAIVYAIEEINKNNSILPNITLGYDIRDICDNKVFAAGNAYQFATASTMNCKALRFTSHHKYICDVNDTSIHKELSSKNYSTTYPVVATVGETISDAAIPLANLLQAVRIPHINCGATSEELSSPMYGSFFRTIPSDVNQAKAFAAIIDYFNWRYVAAVAVDDSYGHYGLRALERESIERKSFCLKKFGYIPRFKYNNKIKIIVSSLKAHKTIKVIILWCSSFQGKEILSEAARHGLGNRVWIFSEALAMTNPIFLSSIVNLSSTGIHIGVRIRSKKPESFLQYLKDKLVAHNDSREKYLKHFWKSLDSKVSCSSWSNTVCNKTVISDAILEMTQNDHLPYCIDTIYTVAHAIDRMLIMNPNLSSNLNPNDLIGYLKTVEFEGITGKVKFDSRGDPVEAFYDIVYFKINLSKTNGTKKITKDTIGHWNKSSRNSIKIIDGVIQWGNDEAAQERIPSSRCTEECSPGQWKERTTPCCWKCLVCTDGSISKAYGAKNCTKCSKTQMSNPERTACQDLPISNIDWSNGTAIILAIISVVGFVIDICAFSILFCFRDTPIVKASNKVYTFVLLLGTSSCFVMTLLYIVKPSSGLCSVLKPLRYVIYTLCCSSLFLKTMQIVHAFNISQHTNWIKLFIISTKRQVIGLIFLISIEVLLCVGWILLDPPYAVVTIIPKSHVFTTCVPFRSTPGQVFDILMLIYLLLLAGCCIYYAFRARNLPANFNEAKYISFSLYIFLLSWITYYPIDYALEGWYVAVLSGCTLLLSSYGLLGCIFVPKLFVIICHPEKNTVEFVREELRQNNAIKPVKNSNSTRQVGELS